jgi:hypothetical protein
MNFLRFNRLYVIESLEADEVRTGSILFEYLQPLVDAAPFTLPMGLYTCQDAQGFRNIAAEVLANSLSGHLPWIHIECHGSDDGLIFANGSEIGWPELCDLLRPINEACGFQLFVALGCCYGGGIVSGIDTGKGAPCLGLTGPSEEIDPGELLGHFRDFYRELITTTDIGPALRSWKSRSLSNGQMATVTAEVWWRGLMSRYLANHASRAGIAATARRQRKILAKEGKAESVGALKRKFIRRLPDVVDARFEAYFMTSEVPANAQRFEKAHTEVRAEVLASLKR